MVLPNPVSGPNRGRQGAGQHTWSGSSRGGRGSTRTHTSLNHSRDARGAVGINAGMGAGRYDGQRRGEEQSNSHNTFNQMKYF